ncbi:MAG: ABC transporter permease, partial [Ginsengibacter sp.]
LVPSDSMKEVLVNETYAKILGFTNPEDIVGKLLYQNDKPYPVVGVVSDFHQGSFHEAIQPVIIAHVPKRERSVAIKLATKGKQASEAKAILANVEKEWKKVFEDRPFNYRLMNESIASLYEQESNTAWLVNSAMLITIFISCMGLFGLGMFTAEKRTKEIGIRKVLGASVTDITTMLNKDFALLVLVAILIASPIAWYLMNQWLLDFAFRTDISWWVFIVAGLAAIIIALLTVSFHAVKAAFTNPVKSLRTE